MCLPLTEKVDDRFLKRHLLWHFWGRAIWDNREWRWSGVCVSIMKRGCKKQCSLQRTNFYEVSRIKACLLMKQINQKWMIILGEIKGNLKKRVWNVPGTFQDHTKNNPSTTQVRPKRLPITSRGRTFAIFFVFRTLKWGDPLQRSSMNMKQIKARKKPDLGFMKTTFQGKNAIAVYLKFWSIF